MKIKRLFWIFSVPLVFAACSGSQESSADGELTGDTVSAEVADIEEDTFDYLAEKFADLKIMRYKVNGFEDLSLKEKELLYYLHQAALSGRDIIWDQNYKHNLLIRNTLEGIVEDYQGERSGDNWEKFMVYTKRIWFSNGIHHHYSMNKILPDFSKEYFRELIMNTPAESFNSSMSPEKLASFLEPIIFDPTVDAKRVSLDSEKDLIRASATNYYEGVTQKEVEDYYKRISDPNDETPVSYGLNSKLIKENGKITEKVWKVNGMYGDAIEKIVFWLEKASSVAENEQQKEALDHLIDYYKTGDLETFDKYNIAWVNDTASRIDVVNGFIEVYGDPMGYKGSFESVVSIKDMEASKRIAAISNEAQWFEDNAPLMPEHKKENVKGISAKVITVVVESGDASPSTPIGINLPNANWIRAQHGSKSVNLGNVVYAYDKASANSGILEEFSWDEEEISRAKKYGALEGNLHTDMHEVIGHASGKLNPGVGTPKETLKNYSSTLEEARADLVALYYIMDSKLVEMGLMPNLEVGKTGYEGYIKNGLMLQLRRVEPGENIEEAHMRNRQLIAKWVLEKGQPDNVIEKKMRDGKTYFVINDYDRLRVLFGDLLREIQRIKSEGDYEAGKALVENYGVKVDKDLHAEVLERVSELNVAPYGGFINPVLNAEMDEAGNVTNVGITYPDDFSRQMLFYGDNYSFLPVKN